MNEGVALKQLADILPPPAPGPGWILPVIAVAVTLAAALILVWFVKRRRSLHAALPASEARQRLTALRSAWQDRRISDREAAYRLATLLRLGLGLPQLAPQRRPPAVDDAASWYETLTQLHALRYRDQAPTTLSPQCFDYAEHWLTVAQSEGS